jgi:hypothetical protein
MASALGESSAAEARAARSNGRRKEYRMPDSDRIKLIDFGR